MVAESISSLTIKLLHRLCTALLASHMRLPLPLCFCYRKLVLLDHTMSFSCSNDQLLSARKDFLSGQSSFQEASARSTFPESESAEEDIFDIPHKHPTTENLQRWKKVTLALNAARRFRYTADLDEERRLERVRKLRASAHAVIAINRFLQVAAESKQLAPGDFSLNPEELVKLVQDRESESLRELGGVRGVARLLGTNLEKGIADDFQEIEKRRRAFGSNTYPKKPPRGFLKFLYDSCKDLTLVILMVCAVLSLALGIKSYGIQEGWYDGVSIAVAVTLVILVTAISDYRQSFQFLALSEEKRNIKVQVIRGGRRQELSIFQVVTGDIVSLNIGDQVPADGLFVDGHSLSLDESSMTGESEPVNVHNRMPYLLSGSKVQDGHGFMLVTGVGMLTEWGQLMAEVGEDSGEETPLQVRLNGVATFIGYVGTSVAGLVCVILFIFYFVGHTEGSNNSGKFQAGRTSASDIGNSLVDIFEVAVTIVVVAVPEGLPLAVTLTLSYSMKKMIADKALVRRLSACETMGSATTICSDKTGTLTLNQMNVVKVWVAGELRDTVAELQSLHEDFHNLLLEGIVQNSSGSVFVPTEGGELEVTGSPTEKAVLLWGLKLGMDFESVRLQSTVLQVETFNSIKKRAGVAVKVLETGKVHAHWKGAAELILHDCNKLLYSDNSTHALTQDERNHLMHVIDGMAAESLRCIAFGFQEVDSKEVPIGEQLDTWKVPGSCLTLLAIIGIKDPCRPEVRDAVRQCQEAGIRVRMVTGDNIFTAKAIAAECGILQEGIAIEGATFRNYTPEMRRQESPNIVLMARSSPSDKLLLVRTLRDLGEVVAVTGDGTNDAPALREADIGLAMGIQGTEVAKENSDILILDDNFASVVKVVRWGRSVYLNIQKFIQFQLTVNVAALTINFVAAVSSGDVPLTAVQLLWVNLIMDTLGALALATEHPTDDLLQRPPVGWKEPLISNVMWRNILSQAFYQIIVLLVLQFRGESLMRLSGTDAHNINTTLIFNAFVFCQLFNEVNARKLDERNVFRGLLSNRLFLGILGFSVVFQVIIVEFLNDFASTVKLEWQYWVISIVIGFVSWPLAFVVKHIPVPRKPILNINLWPFRRKGRRRDRSAGDEEDHAHTQVED